MNNLSNLQNHFQHYLLSGNTDIKNCIQETKKVSRETRLNVYQYAYFSRLEETLSHNFPNVGIYLGDDEFHELSMAYIKSHPSTYRSIRWYGDELPLFIQNYYSETTCGLAELAEFEWNMTLTFDADDCDVIDIDKMAKIPPKSWENLTFQIHPSVRRMNFFWNTISIWEALSNKENPEEMIKSDEAIPWILWRKYYLNRFYQLSTDECWAFDAIHSGKNFGHICEGLSQWHEEEHIATRAASLLANWIHSGMITTILINGEPQ